MSFERPALGPARPAAPAEIGAAERAALSTLGDYYRPERALPVRLRELDALTQMYAHYSAE